MRTTLARALRKWADLIDPRTNPCEEMRIQLSVDTSQFDSALADTRRRLLKLVNAMEDAKS